MATDIYIPGTAPHGPQQAYTTNSATVSGGLTAADVSGGSVEHALNMTGAISAAKTAQLPDINSLIAAIGFVVVGQTYKLRIINSGGSGSGVWTIINTPTFELDTFENDAFQINSAWTLSGSMAIAVGACVDFYVTFTSMTTATLQRVSAETL